MQGPGNQQPGRRAGDSSYASFSSDRNLKEWQKTTSWTGPIPYNADPFEEPADSPELQDERSENVLQRSGKFWEDAQFTGYQTPLPTGKPLENLAEKDRRKRERRISLRAVLILTGLLTAVVLILYFAVFRIREIRVVGNQDISASDVIRFSGIRKGGSILQLSEKETEEHLNSASSSAAASTGNYNYLRLQFRYLEKEMPGTVILAVRERESCCWLTWCGIMYVMDKTGLVLYETETPEETQPAELVEVKGLEIRSGAMTGQHIVLNSKLQESIFNDLFMEMKVLGCTKEILEADLSNSASILLTTRDHFTVSLGTRDHLHAKLKSMMLVRDKLLEMGKTGGSINVINPETPFYSPSAPK